MNRIVTHPRRSVIAALCLAGSTLLAGCSTELASYEDTYKPMSAQENFPITVTERPVKLTLETDRNGLRQSDVANVNGFAQAAAAARTKTPVIVSYASGSKSAKKAATQAAGLIAQHGISRPSIIVTPGDSKGNSVTMSFAEKVAETPPCGDWSENMRANNSNGVGPNFGCANQQNLAAMVSNPEDFEKARKMSPSTLVSQSAAFAAYNDGTWTTPSTDSTFQSNADGGGAGVSN